MPGVLGNWLPGGSIYILLGHFRISTCQWPYLTHLHVDVCFREGAVNVCCVFGCGGY